MRDGVEELHAVSGALAPVRNKGRNPNHWPRVAAPLGYERGTGADA
jgi:hypothetical protein